MKMLADAKSRHVEDILALFAPLPLDDYRYAAALLDPDGRYLLVNQSFASLHGGSPADLRGRPELDLVARAVAGTLGEHDQLALDAAAPTVHEERVMDTVGRRRVVMFRCALRDAWGQPQAVCRMYGSATARDRVLAEFRRLLDALDPTGERTRALDAELGSPAAGAGSVPAAVVAHDDAALVSAKATVEEERTARQQAENLLGQERAARERLDAALRAERTAAAGRDDLARARAAELESALETERASRFALEQRAQTALDQLARLTAQLEQTRHARAQAAAGPAAIVAQLDEARRALEAERARRESVSAQLDEAQRTLASERSTRESLATEVGAAGAAHLASRAAAATLEERVAAERRGREQADARARALETQRDAERRARERAEARARELDAQQAAYRTAGQQAETRARELESQRAAELKVRLHAETAARQREAHKAAERAARDQAETAARHEAEERARELEARCAAAAAAQEQAERRAREVEHRHAAARAALEETETCLRALEGQRAAEQADRARSEAQVREVQAQYAAEQQAREQAEARILALEADRAAAREALRALRCRLEAAGLQVGGRALAAVPSPADRAPEITAPVARVGSLPPAPAAPGVVAASRTAAPRRPRSATVLRPSTPAAEAVSAALSTLLGSPAGAGHAGSLRQILPQALAAVGEESGWDAVTMWQQAQPRRPLTCLGIWTRSGAELDWFESISWRAKLEIGPPPAGDVDPAGHLTWIADLGGDGGTVRERMARSADLTARVLVPLTHGQAVVGALEVFARTARPADETLVSRLAAAGGMLSPLLLRDMHDAEQRRWRV